MRQETRRKLEAHLRASTGRAGRRITLVLSLSLSLGMALGPAAGAAGRAGQSEKVVFHVPGASKSLTLALKNASVLLSTQSDGHTDAPDLFAAARADYAKLIGALYAQGYYSGIIHILIDGREAAQIAPLDAPTKIARVVVTIDPGPRFTFGALKLAPLAPQARLPKEFAPGQPALSTAVQAAVGDAVGAWRDAGHAMAQVGRQQIVADHPARKLDAAVTLVPGPKVTFGDLLLTGKTTVNPARIRQIAGFPTGKTFDPKEEKKAADRLRRAGAFSSVAFSEAKTLSPGDRLDVTGALVQAKRHRIGFGAELASQEGLTLSGFWLNRNFLNDAQQLRLDAKVSGLRGQNGAPDYSLNLRFDRPAVVNPDSALYAQLTTRQLNQVDYTETLGSAEVGLTRILREHLTASAGIGYEVSRVTDTLGEHWFHDLSFPLGMVYDSRDHTLNPQKGVYIDALVKPYKGFGGTGDGAQIKLDARAYKELGKRVTLAARLQFGSVLGSSVADTPRDYLFYSGGGGTVRGQPYQSLGVYVLSPTQRTGGRSFIGLSGEIRTRINASFGVVAFYDAGYVGANSLPGKNGAWQAGAGLGLRYFTGIGPIRLDVGLPVSGSTGNGPQIYVGIGQAF